MEEEVDLDPYGYFDEESRLDVQIYSEEHNDIIINELNFNSDNEFEFQKIDNILNITFRSSRNSRELINDNVFSF